MFARGVTKEELRFKTDGASALMRALLSADQVHFIIGTTVNPAHQNPDLPRHLGVRLAAVDQIRGALHQRGIDVTTESE